MNITCATYPEHAGKQRHVDGHTVTNVAYGEPAQITFQKFTKDYKRHSARPYVVNGSGFATLARAVAAVVRGIAQ